MTASGAARIEGSHAGSNEGEDAVTGSQQQQRQLLNKTSESVTQCGRLCNDISSSSPLHPLGRGTGSEKKEVIVDSA
jgi:hypothetical protein